MKSVQRKRLNWTEGEDRGWQVLSRVDPGGQMSGLGPNTKKVNAYEGGKN